jgi:tetratricopeptide (TPR) repeat protein
MNQNKLDEAMEKYVSALRIFEKAKVAIAVAGCHFSIGNLLKEQGKFDVALEHARKALAIFRSKLSHEHADCANCHALIGDIFLNSGKFAEAVDEYDNVQRIRKDVYGEMTPQIAHLYQGKAECFFKLRNWREAVTFFEAAIHIRTVLGADNASLVKLKARLAAAEEQLKAERSSAAASEPTKR